jgi:crotonobetainyl-CoA:carnitine CoA-transferase CaiB-like acyl-CoA transferase
MLRISGFGQTGPYRERAGYDRIAMAFGGLMGIYRFPTARRTCRHLDRRLPIGHPGAFSLMMAIYRDMHGGEGQQIDLAMYESIIRLSRCWYWPTTGLGTIRERRGNTHFAAAPGEHFRTSDGRYMILTVSADADLVLPWRYAARGLADRTALRHARTSLAACGGTQRGSGRVDRGAAGGRTLREASMRPSWPTRSSSASRTS